MRTATRVCGVLTFGVVACGPPDAAGPVGTARQGLLGGATDASNTGVVGLALDQRGTFVGHCSGTLIAPNLVLTARHCVAPTVSTPDEQVVCGVAEFAGTGKPSVFLASPSTVRPLSAADPTFFRGKAIRVADESMDVCGHDVALLELEQAIPTTLATPITPRIDASGSVDETFAAEGYGYTDPTSPTGDGTRMRLEEVSIRCTGDACSTRSDILRAGEWLSVDARLCPGDSGGPALDAAGKVMGVASRAGPECMTAIYSDVAAFRDLIVSAARTAAADGPYELATWAGGSGVAESPDIGAACRGSCPGDLVCYSETGAPPGVCVPRCGGSTACPHGYSCSEDLSACVPEAGKGTGSGCSTSPARERSLPAVALWVAVVIAGRRLARRPKRPRR